MRPNRSILLWMLAAFALPAHAASLTLVVCAPGYPGSTEQARPVMDDFAAAVSGVAGWPSDRFATEYHETLEGGLARLESADAAAVIVGLPLYLEYRERLSLEPLAQVRPVSGATEEWSLVAHKGSVRAPADLAGWRVAGIAGFAPTFVRRVALAEWGPLPDDVRIEFASRVLSELRKAAAGESTAVLLDRAQAEALSSLPFAADLEVVARSKPQPASLLCAVGDRIDDELRGQLARAVRGVAGAEGGAKVLEEMRLEGFADVDRSALAAFERAMAAKAE